MFELVLLYQEHASYNLKLLDECVQKIGVISVMAVKSVFIISWIFLLWTTFVESVLEKPTDVRIMVNETTETANVSWKKPVNDRITFTYVELRSLENKRLNSTYVRSPASHIVYLDILRHCRECIVLLEFVEQMRSEKTQCRFAASALEKPKDMQIKVNQSALTAKVSWKPPTNKYVNFTSMKLKDSKEQQLLHSIMTASDYLIPTDKLKRCEEYTIELKFCYSEAQCSDASIQKFFTSDQTFTTRRDSDITITWTTSLENFYRVEEPLKAVLYSLSPNGGFSSSISETSKYSINEKNGTVINITVHQGNQSNAGFYRTIKKQTESTESCAVLIVTDNPKTPQLSVQPKTAFVGDNITFTCESMAQRWPEYVQTSLNYTYEGINGTREGDELVVKGLTRSHKGVNVTCVAKDDLGLKSSSSNVIVMDPYYGPETVHITVNKEIINVTEGNNLGPFHCSADCNPPCNIEWGSDISRSTVIFHNLSFGSTLNISDIKRDQSGTFYCQATHINDKKRFKRKKITVNVQYGPGNISIKPNDEQRTVTEGNTLGPLCCDAACNPTCLVKWRSSITMKGRVDSFSSNLHISNITRGQSGVYTCEASNSLGNKSKDIKVVVNYGPDQVIIQPSEQTIQITEGESLGPINCTANCNPTCAIFWRINATGMFYTVSNRSVLSISKIRRNQSGIYVCNAVHDNGAKGKKHIKVNVLYGPKIVDITRYKKVFNITEGEGDSLDCTADCNPPCQIKWTSNLSGRFQTFYSAQMLNLSTIKRNESGEYRCEANNSIGNNMKDITINVLYGPDAVVIEPNKQTINITEEDTLGPLNCSVDCNPQCDIKWRFNSTQTPKFDKTFHTSQIIMGNILRNQTGTYRCVAKHIIDKTKERKDVFVNVLYPSTVTKVELNNTEYQANTSYSFHESNTLRIAVKIDGNPDARVYFYETESNRSPVNWTKEGSLYLFQRNGFQCEDSGYYTIEASNGVKNSSLRKVRFNIECEPRKISFERNIIGSAKGAVNNITVDIVANPKPDIKWNREVNHTWVVTSIGNNKYRGFSQITIADESYFGIYGVVICNKQEWQCAFENITIKAEGKPDPPMNLSVVELSHNWANLSFIAGFNGGQKQTFKIQCRSIDTPIYEIIEQIIDANDTSKDVTITHRVKGLLPNTRYNVTLIAANLLGNASIFLELKTNIKPVSDTEASFATSAIGGTSAGIVLILFLLLIVILVYNRHRSTDKDKNPDNKVPIQALKSSNGNDVGGAEYACVSKVKKNGKENTANGDEYAVVSKVKKNSRRLRETRFEEENNEYAEVDKSNRVKGAVFKIDRGDETVYANSDKTQHLEKSSSPFRTKNANGLIYIEVDFSKPPSADNGRPVIHGADERTDYVDIDFTRRADPLPDSDSE